MKVKSKLAIRDYQRRVPKNLIIDAKILYKKEKFYIHISVQNKSFQNLWKKNNPVGFDKFLAAFNSFNGNLSERKSDTP
ncbi:MAG TPA: hypothetical protein PLO64_07015 [Methanothermobacter sp.]|nr:hypothetical protein [Methanothermobacter sp.]HOK72798.1 hypothetical protein [Methanothermobacter sp.]HOL69664.1 hypothetical protein [Methanothermobacter sp.]HPQ05264.1 hypothetical protein [Methanothermobacter sp.]HPU37883.1 hypothetical protein [Methanothermobacter sp.]